MQIPQRIFLDTSVVNFIVDHSEYILDGKPIDILNDRIYDDICALNQIFIYANHNSIEMIISRTTFDEIRSTTDNFKRGKLENYCNELWKYFHYLIGDDFLQPDIKVKYYEEYLLPKGLHYISGINDRKLIIEALFYKCDIFCTRDWKTIIKHRIHLKKNIPLEILTPFEWYLTYKKNPVY